MPEHSIDNLRSLLAMTDAMSPADQEIMYLCAAAYAAGKAAAINNAADQTAQ